MIVPFRSTAAARAVLLALALLLGPAGAALPQAPDPAPPVAVGKGAVGDGAITDRLRAIVFGFSQIKVTVEAGIVPLRGAIAETADAARLTALAERLEGVVTVQNELATTTDTGGRLLPAATRLEARLRQMLTAVPLVLLSLAAFVAILLLGRLVTRRWIIFDGLATNSFIAELLRQPVRIAFLFVGLAIAIDLLGTTTLLGTILGAAGLLGLAIGFGVRDTIEDLVVSVMLSLRQPFAPDDVVEIEGHVGHLIRLTSRETVLLSPDGNHVRLPNAVVFKTTTTTPRRPR